MTDRLSVKAARERILEQLPQPEIIQTPTPDALGLVLSTDLTAPIDLPPFANSAMDGFAVHAADLSDEPTTLQVVMDIPAGVDPNRSLKRGEAARIMTGAPVPDGADAVVPVEQTNVTFSDANPGIPSEVTVNTSPAPGANIRQQGENIRTGDAVLKAGTSLRPQDIGMLIGLGITDVSVYRPPRVAIISTGDELVGPADPLTPGKIRDTNSYTIAALVTELGAEAHRLPTAPDEHAAVTSLFERALSLDPDIIVSTAGVSVGVLDVVRSVLDDMGEIDFWKVNVRPGKPLAFGTLGGTPFFGLPGNPVSAMITFDLFVRPVVLALSGKPDTVPLVTAYTAEPLTSDGRRTYARVKLSKDGDRLVATSTGTQSSGALMSMVLADGLLIIPEGQQQIPEGTPLKVRLLRNLHFEI